MDCSIILLETDEKRRAKVPSEVEELVRARLPDASVRRLKTNKGDGEALQILIGEPPSMGFVCKCFGDPIDKRTVLLTPEEERVQIHMWIYLPTKDLLQWCEENIPEPKEE